MSRAVNKGLSRFGHARFVRHDFGKITAISFLVRPLRSLTAVYVKRRV